MLIGQRACRIPSEFPHVEFPPYINTQLAKQETVLFSNNAGKYLLIIISSITKGRLLLYLFHYLSPFICLIPLAMFVLPFLINTVRFNLASLMLLKHCGDSGLTHVQFVNRQTNHKVCVKNNCGFAVKEPLLEQAFAE